MYLAYANVSKDSYPSPWVMWAGPIQRPGNHIGNIKFGYKKTKCPENYKVLEYTLLANCVSFINDAIKNDAIVFQAIFFYSDHVCKGILVRANTTKLHLRCGELVDKSYFNRYFLVFILR